MNETFTLFDVADYLDSPEIIAEYLSAAAEDENPDVFMAALGDVARSQGMAKVSAVSGLGRESLYKTFTAGSHPRFETVSAVMNALGLKFKVISDQHAST